MTFLAAAPAAVHGFDGGHFFGSITLSGAAAASAFLLVQAMRDSSKLAKIKLTKPDGVGGLALASGTLFMAAGGAWEGFATGMASLPTSVAGPGSSLGDWGAGGTATLLTGLTFIPDWKRRLPPAFFGISAAVMYGPAGGLYGIAREAFTTVVGHFAGGS
jgi:hypothetical protein